MVATSGARRDKQGEKGPTLWAAASASSQRPPQQEAEGTRVSGISTTTSVTCGPDPRPRTLTVAALSRTQVSHIHDARQSWLKGCRVFTAFTCDTSPVTPEARAFHVSSRAASTTSFLKDQRYRRANVARYLTVSSKTLKTLSNSGRASAVGCRGAVQAGGGGLPTEDKGNCPYFRVPSETPGALLQLAKAGQITGCPG